VGQRTASTLSWSQALSPNQELSHSFQRRILAVLVLVFMLGKIGSISWDLNVKDKQEEKLHQAHMHLNLPTIPSLLLH